MERNRKAGRNPSTVVAAVEGGGGGGGGGGEEEEEEEVGCLYYCFIPIFHINARFC